MSYHKPSLILSRRTLLKLGVATAPLLAGARTFAKQSGSQRMSVIPSSGKQLPAVGMGTYRTFDVGSNPSDRAPVKRVLGQFVALGGQVIDSSPMYGRSESVVGELADELGVKDQLFYATKVWTTGREAGIRQMEQSIQRMQTKHVDLMQIHNLVDWQVHLPTLRAWKQEGRISYLGITHYTGSAFDEMARIMKSEQLDFIQIPYNILDRQAEGRILPLAAERGIGVLVNEPFEKGTLFRQVRDRSLPAWATEFDCDSWAQFFLKYILGHPAVTCVIPATSNPKHLADNMQSGLGRLPNLTQRKRMTRYLQQL